MYPYIMDYEGKPYAKGYNAPSTLGVNSDPAILEMEEDLEGSGEYEENYLPQRITLRVRLEFVPYENDAVIERVINGQAFEKTSLYKPGHVKFDGSENFKAHSKIRAVNFIYEGRGFFLNLHEQLIPFYKDSWVSKKIRLEEGECFFRKPFAVTQNSVKVTSITERDGRAMVEGFGQSTYPRYPYGGYCPPFATLDQMEQIYFSPEVQFIREGVEGTVLMLVPSFNYRQQGYNPPNPFFYRGERYVFPHPPLEAEQMTVGEAVVRGKVMFQVQQEGQEYTFKSCGYEQPGGVREKVQIHFERL